MARIAVAHIGLTGHVGPLARLSRVLSRQGHEVLAWAPAEHRTAVARDGVAFREHEPLPVSLITGGVTGFAARLGLAAEDHAGAFAEALLREDIDLVVHDCHAPWAKVAAEFLGLPRIVSFPLFPPRPVNPMRPAPASAPPPTPVVAGDGQEQRHVAAAEASRERIARRWGVDLGSWLEGLHSPGDLTVAYTTPAIAGPGGPDDGWRWVGPLLAPVAPQPVPAEEAPLVYVSLGTFFNDALEVYRAVIEGMAGTRARVLISTGRGPVSPERLSPLPPPVEAVEYVDGRETLSRTAVMISHCGINSVHEALVAGVPIVCLPQAHDQFGWADRVEALGAGRVADGSPEAIRTAVEALLHDPAPRARAAELGESLLEYDGEERVARLVEEALSGA